MSVIANSSWDDIDRKADRRAAISIRKRIFTFALSAMAILPLLCEAQAEFQTPADLTISDVRMGVGATAVDGTIVDVHFAGWIAVNSAKGTAFIDSRDYQQPLSFQLGTSRLPASWSDVVGGMRKGGLRSVRGPAGSLRAVDANGELLPSDTRVIFEFELLEIRNQVTN